jgi:hypothetical protein
MILFLPAETVHEMLFSGLNTSREGHKTELILLTKDQEGQPMGKRGADIHAKMAAKENADV